MRFDRPMIEHVSVLLFSSSFCNVVSSASKWSPLPDLPGWLDTASFGLETLDDRLLLIPCVGGIVYIPWRHAHNILLYQKSRIQLLTHVQSLLPVRCTFPQAFVMQ